MERSTILRRIAQYGVCFADYVNRSRKCAKF